MVLVMVLLLAKQIITLYHAGRKTFTKDQYALVLIDLLVINAVHAKHRTSNGEQRLVAAAIVFSALPSQSLPVILSQSKNFSTLAFNLTFTPKITSVMLFVMQD